MSFPDMAAVQLVRPTSWFKIGFAGWNCKVVPLNAQSISCLCHTIIILMGFREEILPSFAFFYWALFDFLLPLSSFNWSALRLYSHIKVTFATLSPQTHILPLVSEGGFLYVFSRHSYNTCHVEYFSAKTEHKVE